MSINTDVLVNGVGRLTHREITELIHDEILPFDATQDEHLRATMRLAHLRLETTRNRDPWGTIKMLFASRQTHLAFNVRYDPATSFYWVSPAVPQHS